MEPQFYADLVTLLDLPADFPQQYDQRAVAGDEGDVRGGHTDPVARDEWLRRAEGLSPCVSPVLTLAEAPEHPQHRARGAFVEVDGLIQPAPAPRFSRTPARLTRRPPLPGEHTRSALISWGVPGGSIDRWLADGAVSDASTKGSTA